MPAASTPLPFESEYSAEEFASISLGHGPEDMDDKWLIIASDMTVAFYRSWTGFCIYLLRFEKHGSEYRVAEARVNRDPAQYSGGLAGPGLDGDVRFLRYLIDNMLLDRRTPFPT